MRAKRRWERVLGAVAGVALLSSSALAQPAALKGFPSELELGRFGLTKSWHIQVPLARHRERVTSIKVRDGLLFVQSNLGLFHAIDAESGERFWTQNIQGVDSEVYPPAITEKYIYVTGGKTLQQIDRSTGRIRWIKTLPSLATSGPAANDEYVYVNTSEQRIYAISIDDGEERTFTKRPIKWFYQANGDLQNSPVVLKDRVVFIASDGALYCMHLDEKKAHYRYYTQPPQAAPLATLSDWLYVATVDFNLYVVNLATGQTKWRFPSGFPIVSKPLPFFQDVFITPAGRGVYCLSNDTGEVLWFNQHLVQLVAVSQGHVYGIDRLGNFMIADRTNGHSVGSWPAPDFSISTDNQYNDRIYLSTPQGLVVCLHETQNKEPFLHQQLPTAEKEEKKPEETAKPAKKAAGSFFDPDVAEVAKEMEKEKASQKKTSFFDEPAGAKEEEKKPVKSFFDN